MTFEQLKINKELINALKKQKITKPTQVQEKTYEPILAHKDLLVESETGSGKTLAYLLPLFEKYKEIPSGNTVLILVPTHELAMQVQKQIQLLAKESGYQMNSAAIIGNANMERQIEKLREKPQFIVGSTNRIYELIKKKKIAAHTVKTIVLDEADKLLDANNYQSTLAVIKCTMKDRQLVCFSASMQKKAQETAKEICKDADFITTEKTDKVPKNIKHFYILCEKRDKFETLRKVAKAQKGKKVMVFVNGKFEIEEAVQKLKYHGFLAECIHGGIDKQKRQKAINDFINGKINYLVATDIAARGLHFDGVDTVFHLDVPEVPADYLHRAGRTGRNDTAGTSFLIATKEDEGKLRAITKKLGINLVSKKLYQGKIVKG